jgi:GPH family glycoside/pentoside/hexuronide:cation symporter/glucuronide carrier protein
MENTDDSQIEQESVLTRKEKFGFIAVNLGNIPIMTLMSMYLLYFYNVVVGLDLIAIGTLFLIARVMDGINDPLMGFVIDHLPRTKLGRFRSYILIGSIICSINYALLWLGPSMASSGKLLIAYITYLLFGFTFDLMDIPLNSMIPVMSDRDKDRNTLSNIKGVVYMVGALLWVVGTVPFVSSFPTERQGYHVWIIIASVVVIIFSILGTLSIKERIMPVKEEKYAFKEIVKILGAKPVLILFLETLFTQIGSAVTGAVSLFFFTFVLDEPDLFPIVGASVIIGVIIGAIVGPIMIKKYGKITTKIIAGIISFIGPLISIFLPRDQPYLFVIVALLSSPGMGISSILNYGIQADNMDFIEWKFGFRAEGAVASLQSFIVKAGGGVGAAIAAYSLALINFDNELIFQTEETIRGLFYVTYGIPIIFIIVALLIWTFGYPLNTIVRKKMMDDLIKQRTESVL